METLLGIEKELTQITRNDKTITFSTPEERDVCFFFHTRVISSCNFIIKR